MNKPREFWIEEWNNGNWNSSTCWQNDLPAVNNLIHVIEYAAYEKLQQENEKLSDRCELYSEIQGKLLDDIEFMKQENAKLKQACEVMRDAFKKHASHSFDCERFGPNHECSCGFYEAQEKVKEIFK